MRGKFLFLRLPIDLLWLAVVLAAFGVLVSLVPLPPNDFWWHLKIGTLILDERRIPATNMFGWTLPPDAPFTYGAWLGEALLALLYRAGGLPLPTFARNLLALVAFALIGWEARRRGRLRPPGRPGPHAGRRHVPQQPGAAPPDLVLGALRGFLSPPVPLPGGRPAPDGLSSPSPR
jgi:hypothetical protein